MSKPSQRFSSRAEVEQWLDGCIANGMSTQLIYALVQKKTEELAARKEFYLRKRREALVSGNTEAATELHYLMKETESEMLWFLEVTGSFAMQPSAPSRERILDPEAKEQLLDRLYVRMN